MKTAKLIKSDLENFNGKASLYEVNPPMKDHEEKEYKFVICSTVNAMFSGWETYIFPADEEGNVISWGELEGSQRGTTSHKKVLDNAGYELTE